MTSANDETQREYVRNSCEKKEFLQSNRIKFKKRVFC
jgi:hypothetical protein